MPPESRDKFDRLSLFFLRMIEKLMDLDIELFYKGKALVDLNKVLEIVREEKSENSADVLKQSLEEMQSCLQKIRGESM